jgi:hypothetical protein
MSPGPLGAGEGPDAPSESCSTHLAAVCPGCGSSLAPPTPETPRHRRRPLDAGPHSSMLCFAGARQRVGRAQPWTAPGHAPMSSGSAQQSAPRQSNQLDTRHVTRGPSMQSSEVIQGLRGHIVAGSRKVCSAHLAFALQVCASGVVLVLGPTAGAASKVLVVPVLPCLVVRGPPTTAGSTGLIAGAAYGAAARQGGAATFQPVKQVHRRMLRISIQQPVACAANEWTIGLRPASAPGKPCPIAL